MKVTHNAKTAHLILVAIFLSMAIAPDIVSAADSFPGNNKQGAKQVSHPAMTDEVRFNSIDGEPIRSISGH
jgi:hypothetical protein